MDALALTQMAGLIASAAVMRTPGLVALASLFALPLVVAIVRQIMRAVYAARTGIEPRDMVPWESMTPPARLGRPSWQRRPNVRCSRQGY